MRTLGYHMNSLSLLYRGNNNLVHDFKLWDNFSEFPILGGEFLWWVLKLEAGFELEDEAGEELVSGG